MAWFWSIEPIFGLLYSVFYIQSLDNLVSYQHVQYQKKITDQIFRKSLVTDGQKDRQTDRQTDFIVCCPTNIECPKHTISILLISIIYPNSYYISFKCLLISFIQPATEWMCSKPYHSIEPYCPSEQSEPCCLYLTHIVA